MLFLELATTFPLLAFNALPLSGGQHLLILDAQLPALKFVVIKNINDGSSLVGRGKVCKRKAAEDAVIKVILNA